MMLRQAVAVQTNAMAVAQAQQVQREMEEQAVLDQIDELRPERLPHLLPHLIAAGVRSAVDSHDLAINRLGQSLRVLRVACTFRPRSPPAITKCRPTALRAVRARAGG